MILAFALGAARVHGASAAELLEKAIYTEETKGELAAATAIYQQIIDDSSADRTLVAQAQLRLGLCELKQGNKPRALSALERITQDFPDKEKLLAILDNRMPQLLDEIVRQIQQNYIIEMDQSDLMETALRAIVGKLDSGAGFLRTNDVAFLSTNEVSQLNEGLGQKFAGIGAVLDLDKVANEVVVSTPLPDSPALRGGILAGDRIIKVNGSELPVEKTLEAAVKLLRGEPGSAVTVGVKRSGTSELLELQLIRDTVRLRSVLGDTYKADLAWDFMLDDQKKIGYIRLTQVGKESPKEMTAALSDLESRGVKALVLDLRNNPGGSLSEAVAVADLFIESGRIVTVKGRNGDQAYDAHADGTVREFPIALLVNRQTASAAEIIAASLQDHHRAVVIGERTFGQALVKSFFPLKSGAALKLPVAAYYRPNGKSVHRFPNSTDADDWGIKPNEGYEVAMTDDELKQYEKYRRERDIVNAPATLQFSDRQLQAALGYITTQFRDH